MFNDETVKLFINNRYEKIRHPTCCVRFKDKSTLNTRLQPSVYCLLFVHFFFIITHHSGYSPVIHHFTTVRSLSVTRSYRLNITCLRLSPPFTPPSHPTSYPTLIKNWHHPLVTSRKYSPYLIRQKMYSSETESRPNYLFRVHEHIPSLLTPNRTLVSSPQLLLTNQNPVLRGLTPFLSYWFLKPNSLVRPSNFFLTPT